MNNTNDGGPAFPVVAETANAHAAAFRGMSLRDWFAGMALQSMNYGWFGSGLRIQEMSSEAFNIADAMLAARERKEES